MADTFTFVKEPIVLTPEQMMMQGTAGQHGHEIDKLHFHISLKGSNGRLLAYQWLLSSCAAMGLSDFHATNWPADAVPDFLKFLKTLTHRGEYAPKKYYFLVKVPETLGAYKNSMFEITLCKEARLVDQFKNKAHGSSGELGLYTLEF